MAERIVSPGVFTREKDLSFLPAGVAAIGAAIVGPTQKGPSFVPTQVTSFQEFENIFGGYTKDYYTPYTVREYLRSAGSVTVVRVGYLGGYKANAINLVVSGSGTKKFLVASYLPAVNNTGGSLSGSLPLAAARSASNFNVTFHGSNATASLTGLSVMEGAVDSAVYLGSKIDGDANLQTIDGTSAPVYTYKYFRNAISQSIKAGEVNNTSQSIMIVENLTSQQMDFEGATVSVNASTNVTTFNGSVGSMSGRTPFIIDQNGNELFRVYMRSEGTSTNNFYVIIKDIVRAQAGNVAEGYAQFSLQLYDYDGNPVGNEYNNLNFDPTSPTYFAKAIGDQFQSVDNDGKITVFGDYPNIHPMIRVGDYLPDNLKASKNSLPFGFKKVIEPVISSHNIPTGSIARKQSTFLNPEAYNESVAYGFAINPLHSNANEVSDARQYLSPIPKGADGGQNADFLLSNMKGFGAGSDLTALRTGAGGFGEEFAGAANNLSISASSVQLKFAVPMQHGFDGIAPNALKKTGNDIAANNTMGFDCSSAAASGSIAFRRAINAISNPDEIDINMLATPGIIHKLHPSVTNHAIDKIESRADAFYVMDGSAWSDNVTQAISAVKTLDTNYVGTYYPWVKIDDPDTGAGVWVPPSVVIPGVIAFTDSVAHEWFAPAGLNRGGLSSVRLAKQKLTHTDRDRLYDGRVNPIATFPGQGVVVFGQKTLQAKPSALDRINVRRLLIRLKKFIASSSRFLVFEQNDSATRTRFLNIVNPFLESVQANSGLTAFRVVMDESNNTPDVIDRNQLIGQIFIQPTRTAEFIVLDFSVLPTGAAFPE
tara:strand:+ start:16 stop:2484 length:2469 start_codon:yes stop_codon:yes gene_type:complete